MWARSRFVLRSRDVSALAGHDVKDASDHPDGPGAEAFYRVAGSPGFRDVLLRRVREWWPSELVVDGEAMSFCPLEDVDGEFLQFNSCAAIRALDYVLSGNVAPHLRRNNDLLLAVRMFRGKRARGRSLSSENGDPVCGKRSRAGSSVAKRPSMSEAAVVGKGSRGVLVS